MHLHQNALIPKCKWVIYWEHGHRASLSYITVLFVDVLLSTGGAESTEYLQNKFKRSLLHDSRRPDVILIKGITCCIFGLLAFCVNYRDCHSRNSGWLNFKGIILYRLLQYYRHFQQMVSEIEKWLYIHCMDVTRSKYQSHHRIKEWYMLYSDQIEILIETTDDLVNSKQLLSSSNKDPKRLLIRGIIQYEVRLKNLLLWLCHHPLMNY